MQAEIPNIDGEWIAKVFAVSASNFEKTALEVFRFQYGQNTVYRQFAEALHLTPATVNSLQQVPFLPIRFFKTHRVVVNDFEPQAIFESSGTTQSIISRHYIKDLDLYRQSFIKAFSLNYGDIREYCVIGLLPAYLERSNSSLVVMVDELVKMSGHSSSGFYLYNHEKLFQVLQELERRKQKTLLIGVTFGLLDFADKYKMQLKSTIVMETGGMKGRREEWTREQVQDFLKSALGVDQIHSEYGMTELLSQAYSKGNGLFCSPPWMKIVLREEDDPLVFAIPSDKKDNKGVTGIINVIDLANIYSCSFIATDDVGKLYADNSFEVMGRVDNSDVRGCSLMVI